VCVELCRALSIRAARVRVNVHGLCGETVLFSIELGPFVFNHTSSEYIPLDLDSVSNQRDRKTRLKLLREEHAVIP
jgi:hypothetical protein